MHLCLYTFKTTPRYVTGLTSFTLSMSMLMLFFDLLLLQWYLYGPAQDSWFLYQVLLYDIFMVPFHGSFMRWTCFCWLNKSKCVRNRLMLNKGGITGDSRFLYTLSQVIFCTSEGCPPSDTMRNWGSISGGLTIGCPAGTAPMCHPARPILDTISQSLPSEHRHPLPWSPSLMDTQCMYLTLLESNQNIHLPFWTSHTPSSAMLVGGKTGASGDFLWFVKIHPCKHIASIAGSQILTSRMLMLILAWDLAPISLETPYVSLYQQKGT